MYEALVQSGIIVVIVVVVAITGLATFNVGIYFLQDDVRRMSVRLSLGSVLLVSGIAIWVVEALTLYNYIRSTLPPGY